MRAIAKLGLTVLVVLPSLLAQDQGSTGSRGSGPLANRPGGWYLSPGDTMRFLSAEMAYTGVAVKRKPFTADTSTETTQILGDGNRIFRRTTARLYRDKEGRTRRDSQIARLGPWSAGAAGPIELSFIQDPVARVGYTLNPHARTADKYELKRAATSSGGYFSESIPPQRPAARGAYGIKRESLGNRVIGGVEAAGIRDSMTIPAGQAGNERPIELSYERWYSQDLQLLVMSRYVDPRFGETVYRVTNLRREEPSPSIFAVPPEYRIIEKPPEGSTVK